MIVRLSNQVWFGDKPSIEESMGQVGSIINVAHSIRRPYWQNVGKLDWNVWYFKLALPDAVEADNFYCESFLLLIDALALSRKFPVLCHCRMGGHRGPAAALLAYWYLNDRSKVSFDKALDSIHKVCPKFGRYAKKKGGYAASIMRFCRENME